MTSISTTEEQGYFCAQCPITPYTSFCLASLEPKFPVMDVSNSLIDSAGRSGIDEEQFKGSFVAEGIRSYNIYAIWRA
jgi:hypothetical protein